MTGRSRTLSTRVAIRLCVGRATRPGNDGNRNATVWCSFPRAGSARAGRGSHFSKGDIMLAAWPASVLPRVLFCVLLLVAKNCDKGVKVVRKYSFHFQSLFGSMPLQFHFLGSFVLHVGCYDSQSLIKL